MFQRVLFLMIFILTIACFALGWLARAAGALQPSSPALAGFTEGCEGKPQPCWYGIVPGVTTMEEAHPVLERYGFGTSQTFLADNNQYGSIVYRAPEETSLYY